jgi:hypothetical protein
LAGVFAARLDAALAKALDEVLFEVAREAFAILECFATIENRFSIRHVVWRNISRFGAAQFTRRIVLLCDVTTEHQSPQRQLGTMSRAPAFPTTNNT